MRFTILFSFLLAGLLISKSSVAQTGNNCDIITSVSHYDSLCYVVFIPDSINPSLNYSWDFGDGNTSNQIEPEHYYTASGLYTVKLYVSNGNCSDSLIKSVNTVTCHSPCNIDASFTDRDTTNCYTAFDPDYFNYDHDYYWDFGDGTTSNSSFPTHLYNSPGNYTVTLIASDIACADTVTRTITVNPCSSPCPIDAGFSKTKTGSLTYDFTPDVYTTNYNYHWVFGDGTTSTDPNATHTYGNADNYNVTLVVSDCNCSSSETILLNVTDSSNCNYDANFTYNLESDSSYTFTPNYQSSNLNYYWEFGDGHYSTSMIPNHSYANSGNYTVSLNIWEQGNYNCADTIYQNIEVTDCQLNNGFTATTDTNNTVHFQPNVYNPNYTYEWDFGDGTTSTSSHPYHSYATNGAFLVTLTVSYDSCQTTDSMNVSMSMLNLNAPDNNQLEINIYPNPASEIINIDFNNKNIMGIKSVIYDAKGKIVLKNNFKMNKGENQKQINVESISQGMYQIILRQQNGSILKKSQFVKE